MRLIDKTEIKIFLTFFIIYSFFIHWEGSNENSRFALTQAIVDEGRLTIDSFYNYTGDRSFYNGHYYSDKEPGLSFLAVPVYAAWKFIYYNFFPKDFILTHQGTQEYLKLYIGTKGAYISTPINPGVFHLMSMVFVTVFTSSLFSSLTVVLIYKFTKFWDKNENHRIFATLIGGFATLIFPYGQVFLDYGSSTFFAFLPFYLLFKMRQEKKFNNKCLILAGISSGFAITISLPTIIISIFCLLYLFLIRKEKIHYFFLGGVLGITPLLLYNFLIFGSPFTLARFYLDPEIWETLDIKRLITLPNPFLFYRITFDSYKGIFFYYPILFFSFLGVYYAYKKYKIESLLILTLILAYIVFCSYCLWVGSCFGPKLLTPISPFLVVPLVFVFQKSNKKIMFFILLLFLYSAFVNFIGVAPQRDEIEDITHVKIAPEFRDKINSFEFLANPIYDYYLPMFLNNGIRSRLFEGVINGLVPDIRFLVPEQREFFYLFYFHIPFLSLLPIFLVCTFIWWNNIFTENRKKFISKNMWKILSVLFCFLFLLSLFFVFSLPERLTYYKGWFPPENEERWMGKEGTLLIYNKGGEKTGTLSFYARSYMKDRNIQFYLNDVLIENFTVYKEISRITTRKINLKPGLNVFKLVSSDDCDIPNILEGVDDDRCLSIRLHNVSLTSVARNQTIILKENFYLPEENVSWMRQDGKILIFNFENKTKNVSIQLNLKSFYVDRFVTLSLNGQLIGNFTVFKEGTMVNIPLVTLKEDENTLVLHSMEDCTIVDDIAKNKDFRCISVGIINISILAEDEIKNQNLTFVFNKGWYLELEEGNLKSMRNEGSLLIINNEDHPSTKIISIYLKSFNKDRKIEIIFNKKKTWQLLAFKEGGHINLPLDLHPGINDLEFMSDTCNFPSNPEDKRCISLSVGSIEIIGVDTDKISILYSTNWYDQGPSEEERWMNNNATISIFNFENRTQIAKIEFYLKSFYVDRFVTLYLNGQPIDSFTTFKEGSTIYTPLVTLEEGENQLLLHSMEDCTIVDDIAKNKDFRCISVGIINISILAEDEIKNQNLTFVFNKGWYDKEPQEEERWMNNNATISIFNFENRIKNVTFYFDLVPFYEKKTVHFFLNDKEYNIFDISLDGGEVYTEQLPIFPGENILRFYSDEKCLEIAKIEKNDDYRCVTVGLRSIRFKPED